MPGNSSKRTYKGVGDLDMSRFWSAVMRGQRRNDEIKEYFMTCMDSINEGNLYMIRRACKYISITYLFMILIAYITVPDFAVTTPHILMLPLMLFYYRVNLSVLRAETVSTNMTALICCSFYFLLGVVFTLIDTITYSDKQAYFFPMLILVFPVLYIDKVFKYGIEELGSIVIFTICSYYFKGKEIFLRDMYMILGAYVVSMLLGHIILEMRSREALAMKELKGLSSVDRLTQVLNKGALIQKIENYFQQKTEEDYCSMLILDLDDFKMVNDSLGHSTGDQLLEKLGRLLIESIRAYDIAGRYGGDEFVVLMPQMSDSSILHMRCKGLQKMLSDIDLGNSVPFSMSIGAIISKNIMDSAEVFRMADDALYMSKIVGKNNCTIWKIDNREYDKPLILALSDGSDDPEKKLRKIKNLEFEILKAATDDEALCMISQHHQQLKAVLVEVNGKKEYGTVTLKYMKKRESFSDVPIIAIAQSEDDVYFAKGLGIDIIYTNDTGGEEYVNTINKLIGM